MQIFYKAPQIYNLIFKILFDLANLQVSSFREI